MHPRSTTRPPARSFLRAWLLLGFVLGFSALVLRAPPTDGTVVHGNATIATAPNLTTVTADNNSVLRWGSFDIAQGETVRFVQPGSDARVMNWIGGLTPSQIDGSLLANGQVYLLNPSGVFFGQTAVVDAARLYAVGGSLAKEDFLAGLDRFTGLTGSVSNAGTIRGDMVALIGRSVANTGTIVSPGGFIGLAAGNEVLLGQDGSSIFVNAGAKPTTPPAEGPGVANAGTIDAGAGTAVLAAGDFYSIAITHDGKLAGRDVKIQGQGTGEVHVRGTIDASSTAAGESGGRIEVTGEKVGLFDHARLDASGPAGGGTILIGGDFQGKNPDIRNASRTYVGKDATLNADATSNGDGGKVIIWADDITRFYGSISGLGGPLGGDGGFAEVSGKGWLDFQGGVDLSSALGTNGRLLLDPANITIQAASPDIDGTLSGSALDIAATGDLDDASGDFSGADSIITDGALETLLGTTAVTLAATNNITVNSAVEWNSAFGLSLAAGNTLDINAVIANGGTGALTFTAGAGGVSFDAAVSTGGNLSVTSGGAITQTAALAITGTSSFAAGANAITLDNASNNFIGAVSLSNSGANDVAVAANDLTLGTSTIGQNFHVTATGNVGQSGALQVGGNSTFTIHTNQKSVSLTNAGNNFGGGQVTFDTASGGTYLDINLRDTNATVLWPVLPASFRNFTCNVGSAAINVGASVSDLVLTGTIFLGTSGALTFDSNFDLTVAGGEINGLGGITTSGTITNTSGNLKIEATNSPMSIGALTISGGSVTFKSNQAVVQTAAFTGAGGIIKQGGGTLTLSQANTYTGATNINGGTLVVGAANALDPLSNISFTGGAAILQYGAGVTTDFSGRIVSSNGTIRIDTNGNDVTFASALAGTNTGGLTKSGTGTLTLSGANNYTGTTTVSAGTLALGHATNTLADTSSLIVSGGTLALGANSDTVNSVQITSGSITGSTGVLTSTTAYDLQSGSISAILAGTAGATKSGSGTVTLSGVNTYTGVTTINDGVLSVGSIGNGGVAGNLGAATADAANLVLGGGTLQYTGSDASTDRGFTLTNATTSSIDVSTGGATLTLAGAGAATTGSLTKLGSGGLTLTGANAYTGTTTVSAGTLNLNTTAANAIAGNLAVAGGSAVLQQSDQIANSANVVVSGGTLSLGTSSDTLNGVQLTSGSITSTTGVLTSTTAFDLQAGSVSAILGGTAGLDKTTAGTVTLSGANTYTGTTTIKAGVLALGADAPSGSAGALGGDTSAVLLGDTSGTADASLVVTGAHTVGRAITVQSGSSGAASVGGSNGSGTSTFSGAVTLNKDASLVAASGGATEFSGAITDGAGAVTLTLNGATGSTLKLSGAVTVASMSVAATTQAIAFTGDTSAIDNAVTFANTGALQLGDDLNDNLTFDGGLTATAPSSTALHGTITTSADTLTFGNATLVSDTTLVGTTVSFNGTLTGDNDKDLTITGDAVFGDDAADTVSAVHDLSVSGTTKINTASLSTAGAQTYTGAVTIGNDTTVSATNSNITFSSTVDSEASEANDLTIQSGNGTIAVSGAMGGGTNGAIGALALDSTVNISLPAITAGSVAVTASGVTVNNAVSATTTASFNNSGAITGSGLVSAGTQVSFTGSGNAGSSGSNINTATPTVDVSTTAGADTFITNQRDGGVTITGNTTAANSEVAVTSRNTANDAHDAVTIGAGNLVNSGAGSSVSLTGTSLLLNGDITSPLIILNLAGDLTGTKELQASVELRLNGTGNVGASGSLIKIATPSLLLNKASGDVFVNNGTNALALNVDAFSGNGEFTSGALTLNDALSVGTNSLTFNASSLALGANDVTAGAVTFNNSGALTGTGTVTATTLNLAGAGTVGSSGARLQTDVGTLILVSAGGDAFINESDGLDLYGSTTAALDVVTSGAITQSSALVVAGTATFAAGSTNDITLSHASNNFGTIAITSGKDVTLRDANGLDLGASTVSGALGVTTSGAITNSGVLSVAGTTTLAAGSSNNITLNNASNDFSGAVVVSSGNDVTLVDATALDLGTSTVSGALDVTAGGAITQSGALTVTGTSGFTTGAAAITLDHASNDFTGAVSLNNSGTNNIAVRDTNAIVLGASAVGSGTLTVNAVGITQSGAITQAASAGAATFNGGAGVITLTQNNDFTGAVSLNNSGANDVALTDSNALVLGTSSVGTGALTLNAVGITQTGAITQAALAGAVSLNGGAGAVTLSNPGNDFTGAVTLTNSGANNVTLTDANALTLDAPTVGQDLTVTSGALTLAGAVNVGSNTLTLNTTTLALGGNAVTGGTVTINNSGALTGSSGHSLNATTLNLNGLGAIGTGTSDRIATNAGSIAFNKAAGAGDSFIAETDAVTLTGSTQGALDLTAGGTVTLTGLTAAGGFTSDAAMDISGTITGAMTFTNDVTLAGDTTFANTVSLGVGAGTLSFDANGNALTFNGAITLTSDASFTGGADPLVFNAAIDGAFDLSISAGAGGVSILGGVGATTPLTGLTVTGTASVGGTLRTDGNTQNYGNLILTADTTFVELDPAGDINFNGTINSDGLGDWNLTADASAGQNVTFADAVGTAANGELGTVNVSAAGMINLNGGVIQTTGAQTYSNAVTLGAATTLDTTDAGASATGANISFGQTLDGAQTLAITAGTAGDVVFTGLVGDTAAVGAITINSANDVTANGVRAASLVQTDGTGTTTLNQGDFTAGTDEAVTTTAVAGVNITNETIALNHAITTSGTGTVTLNADTATLTIDANGDIAADGAVALTGATGISTAGDVTTTADNITFNSATTLTGAVALNSANGNIVFNNTVDATTAGVQTLTLAAGTGTIDQNAAMGGTAALGAFTVTSAGQADLQAITATGGAIDVTASTINVDGALTTTGGVGGALSITGGGVTINATPSVGATNVTLTGNGDDVVINSALTDDASITVTAPRDVIINATVQTTGAGSDLVFTADTNTDGVGGVLVRQAGQVDAGRHATLAGSALNSTLDSAAGQSVFIVADGANTQVLAAGNISLASGASAPVGADIQVSGIVSSSGAGTVTVNAADQIGLAANVSTAGGDITFSDAVVLGADVQVGTGATGGNIVFSSTVNGTAGGAAEALTVLAGTGNVTFTGNVGNNTNNTELEALTITSAATALFSGNIELANALTQSAGSVATTFNGTVNVGSAALTGTAFNLNNSFTSAGTTAFTNSGTLTKNATGAITSTGAFSTSGNVNLASDITTTNTALTIGGNLKVADGASVTLSTQGAAGAGDITISGNTDGTTGGAAESLTLNAGTGTLTFTGSIHGFGGGLDSTGLNNVTVTNSGAANFNGTIAIFQALTQTNAATGTTTFGNTVSVGSADLKGTAFNLNNSFASSGTTSFTNSGTLTKNSTGNITSTGAFSTSGDVNLAANITTSDANLTIGGNLVVAENADVTLSTGAVGAGAIAVTGTTNGTAGGGDETLTVLAGTGNVTFTGNVGTNTDALELEALTITSAATTLFSGNIELANGLTQSAGSVATTFNGTVNVGSANLTSTAINLNGNLSTAGGGAVTFTNSGLLTINADVTSDGAVTQNGTGAVVITGSRTISTTSDAVDFLRAVTLNGSGSTVAIDTTASGTGGNITFQGTLDATTAAPNAEDLTLTAGTAGNITFTGAVGGTTRLGDVTIASANDVTVTAGMTAASLVQSAGAGTTTFDGPINANTATGVQITTNNITTGSSGTITTTAGSSGVVTLTNSGTLTIGATINADGNVTQNGTGSIALNADIVTSSDLVQFTQAILLTGDRLIDTTANPGTGSGGAISFLNTVNGGGNSLTLAAPTASGDISFSQAASNLSGLTVTSGRNFSTASTAPITVGSDGASFTVGGTLTLNGDLTTTGGGAVTLSNGGLFTLNSDISADGAVTQNGAGAVAITGSRTISTTSDAVSFLRAVTLNGAASTVAIDTTTSGTGANITFQSTLNATTAGASAEDLTLTAGTAGDVTFTGAAGTTRLGDVTIASAKDVAVSSTFAAATLTQSAGAGTTTFNGAVDTNAAGGISLTGTNLAVNAGITTTNAGTVTVSQSGTATFAAAGDISADGAVSLTATGGISTAGDVTTSGDAVAFNSATNLTGAVAVDTTNGSPAGANITFAQTLDGTQTLALTAGTAGDVTFTGLVGDTSTLGAITINSANDVTANGVRAASLVQTTGTGTTTLNQGNFAAGADEAVTTTAAAGVNVANDVIALNHAITTTGGGIVTLNAENGALTIVAAGDINADGAVSLTASSGISTAGDITATNDNVTFASAVTLTGPVAVNSAGGSINFNSTVDSDAALTTRDLTLTAGAGNITFTDAVGATASLEDLAIVSAADVTAVAITAETITQSAGSGTTTLNGTVNTSAAGGISLTGTNLVVNAGISTTGGGTVTVNESGTAAFAAAGDINADGAVSLTATGGISTAGDITTTNDDVTYGSAVTLTGPVAVDSAGGAISFNSTLDSDAALTTRDLTLTAGAGNITFTGAVGTTNALEDLTIVSAEDVTAAAITAETITQSAGSGTTTFNGAVITSAAGGISHTGTTLAVNSTLTTTGGGTVTINESGAATFASTGDISADGAVSLTASGGISTAGDITTTNDNVTFVSAVTLTGPVAIDTGAGAGSITFSSAIDGSEDLTLAAGTGGVMFSGIAGGTNRLEDVTIQSAGAVDIDAAFSAETLTQLAGSGTTTIDAAVDTNATGGVSLTGTNLAVNAGITTTNGGSVTVSESGTATFAAVGDINADGAVSLTATSGISTAGDITTTDDNVDYVSAVTLTGAVQVAAGAGNVTFSSTVNGGQALTVNASGTTTFAAAVGGGTALASLTTDAVGTTAINGGAVSTTGAQTYNDAVTLGANTTLTASTATFNGTLAGGGSSLAVTGNAVFGDGTGDTVTGLSTLAVSGITAINTGTVTTTGTQTYSGAVILGADTTLTTTNSAVTFASTLDSSSLMARDLTVDAGSAAITLTGIAGGTNALDAIMLNSTGTTTLSSAVTAGSLTTNAGGTTAINGGAVTTTGAQTYNDAVTLSTAANATTLTGADISFVSTVRSATDGEEALTVTGSGTTTFVGAVGDNSQRLASLTTNGGGTTVINGGSVTTIGTQTYTDAVTLGADTTLATTNSTVSFASTLDSSSATARDLTVNTGSGAITMSGAVGGANALDVVALNSTGATTLGGAFTAATLTTNAGGTTAIDGGAVTTTGAQLYNDAVTLGADTTLATTNSAVTFVSTLNSATATARDLTVNAGSGAITMTGVVGGSNVLDAVALNSTGATTLTSALSAGSLTTDAGGTSAINGGAVTTSGAQTYNDAATLGANTTLTAATATFNGTLAGGGSSLTVTGNAVFGDATGDTVTGLSTLGVSGTTTINTNTVTTTGPQSYGGAVILGADTTMTTTNSAVGFAATVNSASATARDLTVDAGSGAITATGAVGGTFALDAVVLNSTAATTLGGAMTVGSLTTNAGGTTAINGGAVTTTGAQTYNDAVTINAAGNATTLTGTNVTFASTVRSATDGEDALTVTGSGTTTFVGAVGDNSQRLAALTSNGGGTTILNGGSVTTTGAQTFTDAVVMDTAGNLMTFTGSDVSFGSSLRSLTDGEEALVVNTTGITSFGGPVGDNGQRLATLTSNTTGLTAINADITTVGAQTYYDDVRIDGDAILTTTNSAVTFADDIDSQALEANDLTVNSGTAAITVSGLIGTATDGAMGTVTFNNTFAGGFVIPTTNAAGLSVTTSGPVTDNGSLAISGQATINAGTNAVTLGDAAGETTNFGSLAVTGGTVIVTEDSGTNLTGITADTLTLTSAGDITDSPGTTINVAGLATFDAGTNAITLGDDPFAPGTLDTTNFGTLTIASAGAVTITEDSSMDLTATTTGDITVRGVGVNISGVTAPAITVYSTGPITDSGPLLISGLALFDAGTFDVTLDDNGNNFSTVQLFGATITITDADLFTLQGLLSSGPFTALSVGDMTVTAALDAAFDLSLTARNGSLILNAPVSSGGNLTLTSGQRFESSSTLAAGGKVQIEAGGAALFTGNLEINGLFTVEASSVQFDGTLNGSGTTGDLRVLTEGETRFNGAIGNANPIYKLTTDVGGTTHIAGGTVAVAGTLEFRDDVVVDVNTTVSATTLNVHQSFVGGTDGGQSLVLNVSGDAVFNGVVGAAGSRFASVGTDAAGRTLFYGGSLRTTGDQIFRDPVLLGRSMTFAGNNVTFANTVNTGSATSPLTSGSGLAAAGDSDLTVVAAGRTLFESPVGQETAGRLGRVVIGDAASTADTTELQANFNATSLEINNPVTFNGLGNVFTVDTTSTQTYASTATLVTNMTFNSNAASAVEGITFQGPISGAGRNISLTAPTGAITTVGNIGAEDARFAEVRVSGRNIVVGGDIWTTGDIRLAMGEGAGADTNDYLAFNVFGSDVAAKSTRLDSETGEIILGTGATSGDPEAAGKGDVPLRATIFKSNEGDLFLMARKITVQPNERLAVRNGSFVAIADGTEAGDGITLSSTAASNLLVLATSVTGGEPSIFLRSRAKANMIAPNGTSTIEDQGTELIAGAVLFYNAAFASDANPMPSRTAFSPATEGGNLFAYNTTLAPGNLLTKLGGVVFEVLGADGGTPELVYVADLLVTNRQYRPTVGNLTYLTMTTVSTEFGSLANQFITPDLFGAIPSAGFAQTVVVSENAAPQQTAQSVFIPTGAPVESASAPPEADLAAAVREQLQALGIYARALTPEEKEARDRLAATFVTVPGRERPAESDYEVADARVEDRAVREVLRVANEIGLIGEGQEALAEVAQALQNTYDRYRAASTQAELDARTLVTEYLAWLAADQGPESARVLAYLKSLGATIRKIELLGLTEQELEVSKAQIYGSVLRDRLNVDPEFLSELVKRVSEGPPVAAKEERKSEEPPRAKPILQAAVPARGTSAAAVN